MSHSLPPDFDPFDLVMTFFVEGLNRPVQVPAGACRSIPRRVFDELRNHPGGRDQFLNLTPRSKADPWQRPPWQSRADRVLSTARLVPCPGCVEIDKSTGQTRVAKPLMKCHVCKDARGIAVPGMWPNCVEFALFGGGDAKKELNLGRKG